MNRLNIIICIIACIVSVGCADDWGNSSSNTSSQKKNNDNSSDYIDSLAIISNDSYQLSEKRIYILDVTRSMIGKGSGKTYDILESVKDSLAQTVSNINDPKTEIVIVPFTNKTFTPIHGFINDKDSLIDLIRKIKDENGDTNIADAWEVGLSYIDTSKVNYIFLLTDGLHNCGPSKEILFQRLANFGASSYEKYMFAFYMMLTPNARELEIFKIADTTSQMWAIESMNINASLMRTAFRQKSNIYSNKTVRMDFISNNPKILTGDSLCFNLKLEDNQYYEISNIRKSSRFASSYEFDINEKMKKIDIPTEIVLNMKLEHNKEKYPFVFFTPDNVKFKIINIGIRKMTLKAL